MLYTLALQRLMFNHYISAPMLLQIAGSAEKVFLARGDIRQIFPDATPVVCSLLSGSWDDDLRYAEREILWCEKNNIRILSLLSDEYPQRMKSCLDAPLALFYRGTADINTPHILSVVGTRGATPYGKDAVHRIIHDLHNLVPDTLIVSGLAYGIDIAAHREALNEGMMTVGVLAHGLDRIYPAVHRNSAVEMLRQGGLISEFPSNTTPEKYNFIRRNRIIAGMADATLVVESKAKGGSLATARIANDYNKEVFALPGRISDIMSEGCNNLIADNKALLVSSAEDIVSALGWVTEEKKKDKMKNGIELSLFKELTPEEQAVVDILSRDDMHQSMLCTLCGIPYGKLSAILFEMEMKGLVRIQAGGFYHLIV